MLVVWMAESVSFFFFLSHPPLPPIDFLDQIKGAWGVESGEVDLVTGQTHTNSVCRLKSTPELLLSLGLDKSLKSTSLATNEIW